MFSHPFNRYAWVAEPPQSVKAKDVGFNDGLSAPQPDFVEGLCMQEYEPFLVNEYVSSAVLYKDNPCSLTLPHIAGE